MKKRLTILLLSILVLGGCSAKNGYQNSNTNNGTSKYTSDPLYGNTYEEIVENEFINTSEENKSNISLTVSTASYTDLRNQIKNNNSNINKNAVKIEEMVNYFSYNYRNPVDDEPLSVNSVIMDTPWNEESKLLLVGLKTIDVNLSDVKNNIVLLVDVSGSMYGSNRLDLVIAGFSMLVDNLDENDCVSIVTYASGVKTVLDGANGSQKTLIKQKLNELKANGSTAGGAAIQKAYEIAFKHKKEDNISSIIIATDGDFNVGISDTEELKAMISEKRYQGVSLSAVGVGFGNMRSDILNSIADAGGGRHAYISNLVEANKCFAEELGGFLVIVANDAKAQIEFNKETISKYRLIGFENRILSNDEWEDEETMAGSLGSNCSVTAMYEVILSQEDGVMAEFSLRYKDPQNNESQEYKYTIDDSFINPLNNKENAISVDDRIFITCVIETGLLLRNSKFKGTASYQKVINRLTTIDLNDDLYKADFLLVVRKLNGESIHLD